MQPSRREFWCLTTILLTTLAAYAPVFSAAFLNLDDYRYLTAVRPFDAARLAWIFTHFFEGYHPLTLATLGLTFRIAEFNPWPHHAINLLLHLANTTLVYRLTRRLLPSVPGAGGPRRSSDLPNFLAPLLTAAIFALHPIHVEAVAWVTSRKDVLYAFFYLLALLSYLSQSPTVPQSYGPKVLRSYFFFLLAVLSKGMAVSFPLALIALDVAQRRPLTSRTVLLEKLPYWLTALFFGWLSIRAQQASGYVTDLSATGDLLSRASLALAALWLYVAHFFQLDAITAFHPYPPPASLHTYACAGAALLLASLAIAAATFRRRPAIAFCILFFLATTVLILQIVPVANFIVADRYAYISSIGFCMALALLITRAASTPQGGARRPAEPSPLRLRTLALAAAAAYLLTLGLATHAYATSWRDSESLWTHVLARHPTAVFPLNMRGCARNDLGHYTAAIADFDAAASADPTYPRTFLNRGFAHDKLGNSTNALADYDTLLVLDPRNALGHNNRGLIFLRQGKAAEAEREFDAAITSGPGSPSLHLFFANRAEARLAQKNWNGAKADATDALTLFPHAFPAYLTRAEANWRLGNTTAAEADLTSAKSIDPTNPRPDELRARWTASP